MGMPGYKQLHGCSQVCQILGVIISSLLHQVPIFLHTRMVLLQTSFCVMQAHGTVAVQALSPRGEYLQPHQLGTGSGWELGSPGAAEKWECFTQRQNPAMLGPSGDHSSNHFVPGASLHGSTESWGTPEHSCSLSCPCQPMSPASSTHVGHAKPSSVYGSAEQAQALHSPRSSVDLETLSGQHTPGVQAVHGPGPVHSQTSVSMCPHQSTLGSGGEMPRRWSQLLLCGANH